MALDPAALSAALLADVDTHSDRLHRALFRTLQDQHNTALRERLLSPEGQRHLQAVERAVSDWLSYLGLSAETLTAPPNGSPAPGA